jgi:hypothetical protein
VLSNGSLVFVTQANALFAEDVSLSISESVDLAILYEQAMTENKSLFSGLSNPFLYFETITDAPEGGLWWCLLSSGYKRCFFDEFVRLGGLTVSVPNEGLYSVYGDGDGLRGFLVSSDNNKEFNVHSDGLTVPTAWFHAQESKTPTPDATASESTPFVVSAVLETAAPRISDYFFPSALYRSDGFLPSPVRSFHSMLLSSACRSNPLANLPDVPGSQSTQFFEVTPTKSEPSSGDSALAAVVGGCVAGVVLLAGVIILAVVMARRGNRPGRGSAGGSELEFSDEVEHQRYAVSSASPLESVNIFASTA